MSVAIVHLSCVRGGCFTCIMQASSTGIPLCAVMQMMRSLIQMMHSLALHFQHVLQSNRTQTGPVVSHWGCYEAAASHLW